MKVRLVAGTINDWHDSNYDADGWRNYTLDVSGRGVWSRELAIPVLPDFVCSIVSMPQFRDGMFDEVRCHHVLEHLTRDEGAQAVVEFARIIKKEGVLDIEVPDLDRVCAAYVAGDLGPEGARQWLLGEQLAEHEQGDSHRFLYTETELRVLLQRAGFSVGAREESGHALRFRGTL